MSAGFELAAAVRIAYKVRALRSQTWIARREQRARAVWEGVRGRATKVRPFRERFSATMD